MDRGEVSRNFCLKDETQPVILESREFRFFVIQNNAE